jgi:hypothetical protein
MHKPTRVVACALFVATMATTLLTINVASGLQGRAPSMNAVPQRILVPVQKAPVAPTVEVSEAPKPGSDSLKAKVAVTQVTTHNCFDGTTQPKLGMLERSAAYGIC